MADETYLVFGDESGTSDLRDDPEFPVFVVAMCVFEEGVYRDEVAPLFEELKLRHFGRRDAPLHERDIRMRQGPAATLKSNAAWRSFAGDLGDAVDAAPFHISAVAIDKRLPSQEPAEAIDPYPLCVSIGLERIEHWLNLGGHGDGLARIVFEARGQKEDRRLRNDVMSFRRVLKERIFVQPDMEFETKAAGLIGLEIADLIAYPIARRVIERPQGNLRFEVIERKLLRNSGGRFKGEGLVNIPR